MFNSLEKVLNKEIKSLQKSVADKDWEIMTLKAEISKLKSERGNNGKLQS